MKKLFKIIREFFTINLIECYCGQWNDRSKNKHCINCGDKL